jgi:hypothetical protein
LEEVETRPACSPPKSSSITAHSQKFIFVLPASVRAGVAVDAAEILIGGNAEAASGKDQASQTNTGTAGEKENTMNHRSNEYSSSGSSPTISAGVK